MRRQPSHNTRPNTFQPASAPHLFSRLTLALMLAIPALCTPITPVAADEGTSGSILKYTTVDLSDSDTPFIKLDTDGEGLYIVSDLTLDGKYLIIDTLNPGDIRIENGALFWLKNFTANDETAFGLGLDDNGINSKILGNGTLRLSANDPVIPHMGQQGSGIYLDGTSMTDGPQLTIEGINLEIVADKAIRVDDGGKFILNNQDTGGHVYIGLEDTEDGWVASTTDMTSALRVVGATSLIDITTDELKIYSQGVHQDQGSYWGNSSSQASLIVTAAFSGYSPYSTSSQAYYADGTPSTIRVNANTMDLWAYGGVQKAAYAISSVAYMPNFSTQVNLSGGTFTLATDWIGLFAQGDPVYNTYTGTITMDFDSIAISTPNEAIQSIYKGASITLNANNITISDVNETGEVVVEAGSYGSVVLTAADTLKIDDPEAYYLLYASVAGTITASASNLILNTEAEAVEARNYGRIYVNFDTENFTYKEGATTQITGDIFARGDTTSSGYTYPGGRAYIGLGTADSVFTGGASDFTSTNPFSKNPGYIYLFAGNGASWNVYRPNFNGTSVDSNVYVYSSTEVDSNGVSSYVDLTGEENGQNLYIKYLVGSDAQFILRTQVDDETTGLYRDHVLIDSGEGAHTILVKAVGNASPEAEDWSVETQADFLIQHYEADGASSVRLDVTESTDETASSSESTTDSTTTEAATEATPVAASESTAVPLSFTLANLNGEVDYGNRRYTLMTRSIKDADGNTEDANGTSYGTEWYLRYAGDTTPEPDDENFVVEDPEDPSETDPENPGTDEPEDTPGTDPVDPPSDDPGNNGTDEPGDTPTDDPGNNSTDEPGDTPTDDPGNNSTDEPGDTPTDDPGNNSTDEPGDTPTDDPGNNSTDEPGDTPTDDPGNNSTDEPGDTPTDDPEENGTDEPGDNPEENPEDNATEEPGDENSEVVEEPTEDPADEEEKKDDEECTDDKCQEPDEETKEDPEPEPEEPSVVVTPLDQDFEHLSSAAQLVTTLAGHGSMYSAWMANLTDLRKRLGEVRYGAQDGLWARLIWQKDKTKGLTGADFEQKLRGLQIGLDHIVTQDEDRMWLVGANFKYADATQKVKRMQYGRGEMRTYGAFLYATYADYKGYYTDLVLSLDHYKEKMTAEQTDYSRVHGNYNTWGWGASIEAGRMFASTQNDIGWGPWYSHWWIEPQVQLSYYRASGQSFTLTNGMAVDQANGDSLVGRLGVVVGKKYNYGRDRKTVDKRFTQFYVKGGVKHEFLGTQTMYVNKERFSDKLRGTRVYYGACFDWNVTDKLRAYAQIEREHGRKYQKDYEVSVGLKWQF